MTMPWFKLYNEFATDPKVQMLSEAMQRRLIMIFCLRSNETLETLHETEVAFHLRITETELQQTKQLFIQKGFIDDDWNVLNWEYRQQAFSTSTERVRKHRIKQKQQLNGNETPIETHVTLHVTPETLHVNARLEEDIDKDKNDVYIAHESENFNEKDLLRKKIIDYAYENGFEHLVNSNVMSISENINAGGTFDDWQIAIASHSPDKISNWNYLSKIVNKNTSNRLAGLPPPQTKSEIEPIRTYMQKDFIPTDDYLAFAQSLGLSTTDAGNEWKKFKDHQLAKANKSADWLASWKNWVRTSIDFQNK
jgi:hypothetical protein